MGAGLRGTSNTTTNEGGNRDADVATLSEEDDMEERRDEPETTSEHGAVESRAVNAWRLVKRWQSWSPYIQSILRMVAALVFMTAGSMKLFAVPMGMPGGGTVHLISELGLAGVLEVFGGGLILLGLFTRPVAFILSGEMAVAYFQAHFPRGPWPTMNGGMGALLYCFIWLYLSSAGAGAWSIDALRAKRRRLTSSQDTA